MNTLAPVWTDEMRHGLVELQQRPLLRRLLAFAVERGVDLYVVGGTLRDLCLGRSVQDMDLTMHGDVMGFALEFANDMRAAYVPMDAERGEARVVYRKRDVIDLARLRGDTIMEDVGHRDFTINAMACPLEAFMRHTTPELIDRHGGWHDLQARIVRMVSGTTFQEDPLRLLRAFRLAATLDFSIAPTTLVGMEPVVSRLGEVAPERIHRELLQLFAAPGSTPHVSAMAHYRLLDVLFPELAATREILCQPDDQADLFAHAIRTYQQVADLIDTPSSGLPIMAAAVSEYFRTEERRALVQWAALLHAIGATIGDGERPQARAPGQSPSALSARLWRLMGERLKLSRKQIEYGATLIGHRGRLLQLATLEAQGHLTWRLVHGWSKEVGDSMLGICVLAIGHALAAEREDTREPDASALGQFIARLWALYQSRIVPVITAPRLVTGDDLQQLFNLTPGPRFKAILDELEVAQVEGRIRSRQQALQWVAEQQARL